MTDWAMQSDSVNSRILPQRLGAFLRRQVSAKQLSRQIDCDERTAFKIRAGEVWPMGRHMLRIWLEFGDDCIEAVYYPERVQARLAREAEAREQERRQRIASAAGLVGTSLIGLARSFGEGDGADEDPAELGPPNLDLFEARP